MIFSTHMQTEHAKLLHGGKLFRKNSWKAKWRKCFTGEVFHQFQNNLIRIKVQILVCYHCSEDKQGKYIHKLAWERTRVSNANKQKSTKSTQYPVKFWHKATDFSKNSLASAEHPTSYRFCFSWSRCVKIQPCQQKFIWPCVDKSPWTINGIIS